MEDIAIGYLKALGLDDFLQDGTLPSPSFELLKEIKRQHARYFPFCTANHVLYYHCNRLAGDREARLRYLGERFVDAPAREELSLEPRSLYERLIVSRFGGYCMEHNKLLFVVLKHLGFSVRLSFARVYNANDLDEASQRERPGLSHLVNIVECDGATFLVDVAFGMKGATQPLRLPAADGSEPFIETVDPPQDGEGEGEGEGKVGSSTHRVVRISHFPDDPDPYSLLVTYRDSSSSSGSGSGQDEAWFLSFRFDWRLNNYADSDLDTSHFYSHANPNGVFTKTLVSCRRIWNEAAKVEEMHSVVNLDYSVQNVHERSPKEERHLDTAEELREVLTWVQNVCISEEDSRMLHRILLVREAERAERKAKLAAAALTRGQG